MGWFEGRVAVVTGAASGLGRAVAERIAAEGGAVVVADIAGDRAHETAARVPRRTAAAGQVSRST